MSFEHPGLRFGGLKLGCCSPKMSVPSEPATMENGTPSLNVLMVPNCQPPSTRFPNAPSDFGAGAFHRALITRTRLMSKSDNPLLKAMSNAPAPKSLGAFGNRVLGG